MLGVFYSLVRNRSSFFCIITDQTLMFVVLTIYEKQAKDVAIGHCPEQEPTGVLYTIRTQKLSTSAAFRNANVNKQTVLFCLRSVNILVNARTTCTCRNGTVKFL